MKVPWPQPFEDGDVKAFLEEFEDVAELAGVKTDRGKLVALRALLKGRALAVLDAARRGPAKLEWAAAKDALVNGFDTPADRQDAMRRFKATRLGDGADPMVYAVALQSLLRRALPQLDPESQRQLLVDQFLAGLPAPLEERVRLVSFGKGMDAYQLAEATRELAIQSVAVVGVKRSGEQEKLAKLETTIEDLVHKVEAIKVTRPTEQKPRSCFLCGRMGHWRAQCPQRRRSRASCSDKIVIGVVDQGAIQADVEIDGKLEKCLIDTGAAISLARPRRNDSVDWCSMNVKTVGGYDLRVDGVATRAVQIGRQVYQHKFVLCPDTSQTILGADFLRVIDATIDLRGGKLTTKYGSIPLDNCGAQKLNALNADKCPTNANPAFRKLVAQFAELFTDDGDPYGFCDWIQHEIPLTSQGFRPYGPRRIPIHLEHEVKAQTQQMLNDGIIEESSSPFNSPVLLVKKSNGKFRFCVDFRRLNEITLNKIVPVPTAADVFDRLQCSNLFTVLDLRSGYWQVPIKPADRAKTAFTVGDKQYQFKRMPFGLSGAPFTFRLLMRRLLDGLHNVAVYGDDIVVYSMSEAEHMAHLEALLRRIRESGLRINGPKSQLGKTTINLLGHKVGCGDLRPLPEKILKIKDFPTPSSKRTLRRFLGAAGYYSRFVKNFSAVAEPLYALLRKEKCFQWNPEAQESFEKIKKLLNEQKLTLKLPVAGRPFTVTTDASDLGIGAVLKQENGVIEYASRILTPTERKYSTTEKECLAMVWALDKWRPYLLGQKFILETDHKPLKWIQTTNDPRGKLARWALRLQEYDFTIKYVSGSENYMADVLSRPAEGDDLSKLMIGVNGLILEQDPGALVEMQRKDRVLRTIMDHLRTGDRFNPSTDNNSELKELMAHWDQLYLNTAGVLMLRQKNPAHSVVVIPRQMRKQVIVDCHEMAHTGCARTYDLLRQRVYWPNMKQDVTAHTLACQRCQLLKGDNRTIQQPIHSIPVSEIGELWSVDVMGPFPMSARGNQYIVVMTEHFTRWIEASAIPDQRASTVSEAVMKHIVADHGVPKAILTDQGPCFESEEFRNCLQNLGIKKLRTTPYHPQTNGLTERNNRTLKEWLAAKGGEWERALPLVLLAHRASAQASTRKSPFQLMYGRIPRIPVDLNIGIWPRTEMSQKQLREERAEARTYLKAVQDRTMQKSKRNMPKAVKRFCPGDKVKYKDHTVIRTGGPGSRKLQPRWKGPYVVVARRGPVYTIRRSNELRTVNGSELQKWHESPQEQATNEDNHPRRRSARLQQRQNPIATATTGNANVNNCASTQESEDVGSLL